MEIIILGILIGLIPAAIANSKGHSFFGWWVFGALLFIVALPWAIVLKDANRSRTCPFCAEKIMAQAIVCPHCQKDLPVKKCKCGVVIPDDAVTCARCAPPPLRLPPDDDLGW